AGGPFQSRRRTGRRRCDRSRIPRPVRLRLDTNRSGGGPQELRHCRKGQGMNWRASLLALTLSALPLTALGQDQSPPSQAEPNPAPPGEAQPVETRPSQAEDISNAIFGSQEPPDYAFGAFQRGYFLTALELALPRAEKGDAAAQTLIAEIYAKGLGVGQNMERAAGWYQLASRNGDMLATFELGMLYQEGAGVEKDRKRAAELFAKAAEWGYIPAKY